MKTIFNITSVKALTILLYLLALVVTMNIVVIAIEYYINNYTSSTLASSHSFKLYVTGMFNLEGERNIPTYFSTLNFLISATLLFTIANYVRHTSQSSNHNKWRFMGYIFVWLALDELFQLHEISINPMRAILQSVMQQTDLGFLHFPWFIPYIVLLIIAGLYLKNFVFSLPRKTFINFTVAGVVFLSGAVGMEMVGGYTASIGLQGLVAKACTTIEETLEMFGIILFIYALLKHIEQQKDFKNILINITFGANKEAEETTPVAQESRTSDYQVLVSAE